MGMTRRGFIESFGAATALGWTASPASAAPGPWPELEGRSVEDVARDEDFWAVIQAAYPVDRALINLNNGGVSPSPRTVQEALRRDLAYSNGAPSYTMWRHLEPRKELVRQRLARLAGAPAEEIAITRNATESLDTVIFGLNLEPGDEVLTTDQDYPRMINAWRQRELRDGIVLRQISIPTPPPSREAIVSAFRAGLSERTKVVHLCHMINLTGTLLPVREIADLVRGRDVQVIVDGAHSFAHIDFAIPDLGVDYFGASLHKWLSAPIGTGLLWVRSKRIGPLWPLFAHTEASSTDIRKLEQIGTYPVPIPLAISEAIQFQEQIGTARKEARLRFLRDYWVDRLQDLEGFCLHTSRDPGLSGGIATFELVGVPVRDLGAYLLTKHQIITTGINHPQFSGLRISPHVYTSLRELDHFVAAVRTAAQDGI